MTVVRREARQRWLVVLTAVAVLVMLPAAVQAWPARSPGIDRELLRQRIRDSAGQPYQGYALSNGSMGLPELPRLGDVSALVSGTTQLRGWYAARDSWRVDVVDAGSERGLYRTPNGEYGWDYGANQLTHVIGEQPVRLPRAADLMPPDLARRLLAIAADEGIAAVPARRVAGISAAGLRIIPTDPRTTVRYIDIWADPATGLPLQVELTGRDARRPILITRFLQVSLRAPDAGVVTPPTPRPEVGFTTTHTPDILSALERVNLGPLPDRLVGQPRHESAAGVSVVGVYGTGLTQYVVLPVPGRLGYEAYDNATRWGRRVPLPGGDAALIATSLLSVLVVKSGITGRTYLLAGLVDPAVLQQAAAELSGFRA